MQFWKRIMAWFDNMGFDNNIDFRLERYLAGSNDICDLEQRQKKWLYMSESDRNRWFV